MNIIKLQVNDLITMKKNHPCSPDAKDFTVLRIGSDIRIRCASCGRELTIERVKLEKNIRALNGQKLQ